jgi:hypothetical protein
MQPMAMTTEEDVEVARLATVMAGAETAIAAPLPGAPITKQHNNRTFNWTLKCMRWTMTHVTATHTGGKAANTNAVPENCPSVNFSLIQDPSFWSTAAAGGYPSMSDVWFGICAAIDAFFLVSWLFWVLNCDVAPHLLNFMQVVGSVVKASAGAAALIGTALVSKSVMLPCTLSDLCGLTIKSCWPHSSGSSY